MTRQELKNALIQGNLYHPPYRKDHPYWKKALEMYISETGDEKTSLSCGSCFNKIKKWLEK